MEMNALFRIQTRGIKMWVWEDGKNSTLFPMMCFPYGVRIQVCQWFWIRAEWDDFSHDFYQKCTFWASHHLMGIIILIFMHELRNSLIELTFVFSLSSVCLSLHRKKKIIFLFQFQWRKLSRELKNRHFHHISILIRARICASASCQHLSFARVFFFSIVKIRLSIVCILLVLLWFWLHFRKLRLSNTHTCGTQYAEFNTNILALLTRHEILTEKPVEMNVEAYKHINVGTNTEHTYE